jgi:tetratricopeptide (TPR) repeat protein
MENHDGAYRAWKQAGIQGRVLLHIDAHLDWDWIKDKEPLEILHAHSLSQVESMLEEHCLWNLSGRKREELVDIGNYIYPAVREGIIKEFYSVVPDPFLQNPTMQRDMVRMFHSFMKKNPRRLKNLRLEDKRIVVEIDGVQVTTCRLSDLPRIPEPVLLDIDTDFLTTEAMGIAPSGEDLWKQLPWIWPEELIEKLTDLGITTDFVTIAYSVEEGYTPLSYKYLGDELALRLKHPTLPARHRELLAHKRRGAHHRSCNELDQAMREFERAMALAPEDASTHFNLARLYDENRSFDQAAALYRQAVQLDPTYATAYNNFGSVYQSLGMLDQARDEYLRILRWDPRHADAHYGLAEVLAQKEQWEEASLQYRTVMELCPDHAGAHRGLGYVYARRNMRGEAIIQLQRSIALEAYDGRTHCWLGELCSHENRWDEAIEAYRGALRCGVRVFAIYLRLGRLHLRQRRFYKAWKQYQKSLPLLGWSALRSMLGPSRLWSKRIDGA